MATWMEPADIVTHIQPSQGIATEATEPGSAAQRSSAPSVGGYAGEGLHPLSFRRTQGGRQPDAAAAEESAHISRQAIDANRIRDDTSQTPATPAVATDRETSSGRAMGRGRDYRLKRRDISEYLVEKKRLKHDAKQKRNDRFLLFLVLLIVIALLISYIIAVNRSYMTDTLASNPNALDRWPPIWSDSANYPAYCVTPKNEIDKVMHCHGMKQLPNFTRKVESMEIAYMSGNEWQGIPNRLFQNLPNLLHVDLSRNEIVHLDVDAFYGLRRMENLSLAHNQLSAVNEDIFSGLENLQRIRLDHNILNDLPPKLLTSLPSLKEVDLRNNPPAICNSTSEIIEIVHLPESCEQRPPDDPCAGILCSDHGSCHDGMCVCVDDYTGARCETEINPCASDPCKSDISCVRIEGGYTCQCVENCYEDALTPNVDPNILNRRRLRRLFTTVAGGLIFVAIVISLLGFWFIKMQAAQASSDSDLSSSTRHHAARKRHKKARVNR